MLLPRNEIDQLPRERAGQLATGSIRLTIKHDGAHCYEPEYER